MSTSVCRFFLLLNFTDPSSRQFFRVYSQREAVSSPKSYRSDLVLVTRDGLLATTSQDYFQNGMPDYSILAVWMHGYIKINTVLHISSHWFHKNKFYLRTEVSEDPVKLELYNLVSANGVANCSVFNTELSASSTYREAYNLTKDAWSQIIGKMCCSSNVNKGFGSEVYTDMSRTCSLRGSQAEKAKKIGIKAIDLAKRNTEFLYKLAHMVNQELIRVNTESVSDPITTAVSSKKDSTQTLYPPQAGSSYKQDSRKRPGIFLPNKLFALLIFLSTYMQVS